MKSLFYLFIAFVACTFLSCKKDKLPKPTQTGANTFGCKIDGVIFKPSQDAGLFGSPPITVYNLPYNGFTLLGKFYGDRSDPFSKVVMLNLVYLRSTGTYNLNDYPNGVYAISYAGGPSYKTNTTHTGSVTITRCDTVNRIYSGTFSFTAIDDSTAKVVTVTDGRFDVKQ